MASLNGCQIAASQVLGAAAAEVDSAAEQQVASAAAAFEVRRLGRGQKNCVQDVLEERAEVYWASIR